MRNRPNLPALTILTDGFLFVQGTLILQGVLRKVYKG
jgi:hypothetical protein